MQWWTEVVTEGQQAALTHRSRYSGMIVLDWLRSLVPRQCIGGNRRLRSDAGILPSGGIRDRASCAALHYRWRHCRRHRCRSSCSRPYRLRRRLATSSSPTGNAALGRCLAVRVARLSQTVGNEILASASSSAVDLLRSVSTFCQRLADAAPASSCRSSSCPAGPGWPYSVRGSTAIRPAPARAAAIARPAARTGSSARLAL